MPAVFPFTSRAPHVAPFPKGGKGWKARVKDAIRLAKLRQWHGHRRPPTTIPGPQLPWRPKSIASSSKNASAKEHEGPSRSQLEAAQQAPGKRARAPLPLAAAGRVSARTCTILCVYQVHTILAIAYCIGPATPRATVWPPPLPPLPTRWYVPPKPLAQQPLLLTPGMRPYARCHLRSFWGAFVLLDRGWG